MLIRKFSISLEAKKFCKICKRNGHEDESCAAIPVTFTWKYGGTNVFVVGSFNQWQVKHPLIKEEGTNYFKISMPLAPGVYQYKFIVDNTWECDPQESTVSDYRNNMNNVIEVLPANFSDDEESDQKDDYIVLIKNVTQMKPEFKVKKITYDEPAIWVSVKGSWDNWEQEIALKQVCNSFTGYCEFYVGVKIAIGTYQFKFIVDGEWVTSSHYPIVKDEDGSENNLLIVSSCSTLTCPISQKREEKTHLEWKEESRWSDCGKIRHTFQGHSMSVICDTIYIFAGLTNGKFTNTLYTFDVKDNEFSIVEDQQGDIPDPRAFHYASVFGTKILVYGGFNEEYLIDYHSYNTLTKKWTKAEIDCEGPGPRERATLTPYVEDKLVHFGGCFCSSDMEVENYFNDIFVLNLSLMEWVQPIVEGESPAPRSAHTSNFVKGKMYMFGGMTNEKKNFNDIWVLSPNQNGPFHWKKIEAKGIPPEARHGHTAVTTGTNIIFFGGRGDNDEKSFEDLFIFNCVDESWVHPQVGGIKPPPRYYHASVAINGGSEVVIFGGVRPKEFLNSPRMYILETHAKGGFEEEEKKESEFLSKAD